jgi:hypothetical protein
MKELQLASCTHFSVSIPFEPSTALTEPITSSKIEPFKRGCWSLWNCPSRGGDSRYSDYGVHWSGVDRRSSPIKLQLSVWWSSRVVLAKHDLLDDRHSAFPVQFPVQPTGHREFLFSDVLPGTILSLDGVVKARPSSARRARRGALALERMNGKEVRSRFTERG